MTDGRVKELVQDEFEGEPGLDAARLGVVVEDGIATLTGAVESYAQRWAAERAALRVAGVRGVVNEIEVRLPGWHVRSDADLARAAVHALEWHVAVPQERVKVSVRDGWVTLHGEVEWDAQRAAAEEAVRTLTGVRGVTDEVTIEPRRAVPPADVKARIEAAFRRSAELHAQAISVETYESTVELRGTVNAWTEREAAERAAWTIPGVTRVENRIQVAGQGV